VPRTTTERLAFRAMGVAAEVIVVGGHPGLAAEARRRIDDLERRWSRFLPGSEVSRLAAGATNAVSDATYRLLEAAVAAWEMTSGRFDPTVCDAVEAAGYDRSFDLLPPSPWPPAMPREAEPEPEPEVPGCSGVLLHPDGLSVTLPDGVRIDPGGIGKGLAGDLVVAEAMEAGAHGALVNLGGDVCVAGEAGDGRPWIVAVEEPFRPEMQPPIARYVLGAGAVATSSRRYRKWIRDGERRHHIIDPATGRPATSDVEAVTVVAGTGWVAEAFATAAFVAGASAATAILGEAGLDGVVATSDRQLRFVDSTQGLSA
jgi:thiamine biosynthesis lipoprotein